MSIFTSALPFMFKSQTGLLGDPLKRPRAKAFEPFNIEFFQHSHPLTSHLPRPRLGGGSVCFEFCFSRLEMARAEALR